MRLSLIILNYKTRDLLKQCLRGLESLQLPFDHEIIVVDNKSGDGSVELVREFFPKVRLIASNENGGFAKGMNLGIREAKGEYFLLLNTDIIVLDDTISRMVAYMDHHQDIGMLGPKLMNADRTIQYSCLRFPKWYTPILRRTPLGRLAWSQKELNRYLMKDWDHTQTRSVNWVLGGFMLVRRKALDEVGAMDENFFLYMEDVDFCRRFWEKKWKVVYFADSQVIHYHKRESAAAPWFKGFMSYPTRLHMKSFWQYLKKYRNVQLPEIF